ncbi:MAG: hypothetical protein GTO55_10255 [Armatimonadetes bacterium]|nr:hypothetical protein [Armatimonadota bacterium]NIM24620.1 hypothetical protein [Armatimonadota bacterium]NIM68499.1 hypothetical protein [Armatimonadota bacterium]NIM76881.1 hypothetical protein [Armatimonadota bacterium]NIN06693.1 hypothetical protein [Armatimonadota bacterium]
MSKENKETIECPCYRVCSGLDIKMGQWCRYRKSEAPPPGMHAFDPRETWCPPGVRANVLMLGYMLAEGKEDPERLEKVLEEIRRWNRTLRSKPAAYNPAG